MMFTKRLMRSALFAMPLLWLAGLGGGCAATVQPRGNPTDPVPVFVADYGVHSSLFLPTPDGRFVEYAFGDWNYAVNNRRLPNDALGALLVSRESALGRRFSDYRPADASPTLNPADSPDRLDKIYCERADAYGLVAELDARYRTAITAGHEQKLNAANGILFVKDGERYSVANNCNHLTARMLRRLGCEVKGTIVSSNFSVAAPKASRAEPVVEGWETASVAGE